MVCGLFSNRRKLDTPKCRFISCAIVLGLLAGFIGSKIVNKQGEGLILDVLLANPQRYRWGWLFNTFGASVVTELSL
jgi:uncharacterized membrane protein YeaQ/YmgE (transglycosylase-associated protein family)